jgi:tRNA(His) guanylyltransferase
MRYAKNVELITVVCRDTIKFMKDELGERMKSQYEDRTRYFVPRRTYTIIRLDGKAFHTYTRGLVKPFDSDLSNDIDNAIIAMLPHIQGAVFAYTQSDEISVLVTDFALPTTSAWFDGNIQKMASVSASILTANFNFLRMGRILGNNGNIKFNELAHFDARVFTIPDKIEVMNYFIWRNQDCARNSVSMLAQANFSHKELQGKPTIEMIEMLRKEKDVEWLYYPNDVRFGRLIIKEEYMLSIQEMDDFEFYGTSQTNPPKKRTRWLSKPAWRFTENKDKILEMIPKYDC